MYVHNLVGEVYEAKYEITMFRDQVLIRFEPHLVSCVDLSPTSDGNRSDPPSSQPNFSTEPVASGSASISFV